MCSGCVDCGCRENTKKGGILKTIDRTTLRLLSAEIAAAVAAVGEKNGVSIKVGRGTYGGQTGSLKLELGVLDESGTAVTREAEDFKLYAELLGFKAEDLGRTFRYGIQKFTLSGYRSKARAKPILATGENGSQYVFTTQAVKAALALEEGK